MKRQRKATKKSVKVKMRTVESLVRPYTQKGTHPGDLVEILHKTGTLTTDQRFMFEKIVDECGVRNWALNITKGEKGTDFEVRLTFNTADGREEFEKRVDKQLNGRMILC